MRWPSALLVAALAVLLTALAGPSAAAAEPLGPAGTASAAVHGIAPNGSDAAQRAAAAPAAPLIAPLPAFDVPPDLTTPVGPRPCTARVERAPDRAAAPGRAARSGRAPPLHAAP